jgi:hypothetical protein
VLLSLLVPRSAVASNLYKIVCPLVSSVQLQYIFELQTSDKIKMEGNEKRDGEGIIPQEVSNFSTLKGSATNCKFLACATVVPISCLSGVNVSCLSVSQLTN